MECQRIKWATIGAYAAKTLKSRLASIWLLLGADSVARCGASTLTSNTVTLRSEHHTTLFLLLPRPTSLSTTSVLTVYYTLIASLGNLKPALYYHPRFNIHVRTVITPKSTGFRRALLPQRKSLPLFLDSCRNSGQPVRINSERFLLKRMPAPCSHFRAESVTSDVRSTARSVDGPAAVLARGEEGQNSDRDAAASQRFDSAGKGPPRWGLTDDVKPFLGSRRASFPNAPGAGA